MRHLDRAPESRRLGLCYTVIVKQISYLLISVSQHQLLGCSELETLSQDILLIDFHGPRQTGLCMRL